MRSFDWRPWLAALILIAWGASVAFAESKGMLATISLPDALWVALVAGGVQGFIWYGAINAKFTALSDRMARLEKRYDSLLEQFINYVKDKKP